MIQRPFHAFNYGLHLLTEAPQLYLNQFSAKTITNTQILD